MSSKKEDLENIDKLVRKRMIECLSSNKTDLLPELNTAIQYLAKNNLVEEKARGSVEEDIANKVAEANKRRGGKK